MIPLPLLTIKQYLINYDYNALLKTTKLYYTKEYKFLNLNTRYTIEYSKCTIFQEIVHSRIFNKLKQIGLNILDNVNSHEEDTDSNHDSDTTIIPGINSDTLNNIVMDDILVHSIKLVSSQINYFDNFKYIQNLTLIDCNCILALPEFYNLKKLKLVRCNYISDISSLTELTNIVLDNCSNISNISSLFNIQYIILSNCINITDISSLVSVKEIYIKNQYSIVDISSLKYANIVSLNNCTSIIDLSGLTFVNTLILTNMNIININLLTNIKKLITNNCIIINGLYTSKYINNNIIF